MTETTAHRQLRADQQLLSGCREDMRCKRGMIAAIAEISAGSGGFAPRNARLGGRPAAGYPPYSAFNSL